MNRSQIVSNCLNAIQSRNISQAESYLADDFEFTGAFPKPYGKKDWINIQNSLATAFPDWAFNLADVEEKGERVVAKVRITGQHTGNLTLPDVPPIKATGKRLLMPQEPVTFTFSGDKIKRLEVGYVPNGGIDGILEQIGAHQEAH